MSIGSSVRADSVRVEWIYIGTEKGNPAMDIRARLMNIRSLKTSRKAVRIITGGLAMLAVSVLAAPTSANATSAEVDQWIKASLAVMRTEGIPGSYDGIYRNLMRESSGNQYAINLWDSNARAGIPSKGLMQVIGPTFREYHIQGTSWNIYDPIANITAACNYAAHRYGSIDNVNSAY